MGVSPRRKKQNNRGRATAKVTTSHGEEISREVSAVDYPTDGGPHSTVSVRFGVKEAKEGTYASAMMEIEVTLPCNPGEEVEASEVAVAKVDEIFNRHDPKFQAAVASL